MATSIDWNSLRASRWATRHSTRAGSNRGSDGSAAVVVPAAARASRRILRCACKTATASWNGTGTSALAHLVFEYPEPVLRGSSVALENDERILRLARTPLAEETKLLTHSDVALYEAKRRGRKHNSTRRHVESELFAALARSPWRCWLAATVLRLQGNP